MKKVLLLLLLATTFATSAQWKTRLPNKYEDHHMAPQHFHNELDLLDSVRTPYGVFAAEDLGRLVYLFMLDSLGGTIPDLAAVLAQGQSLPNGFNITSNQGMTFNSGYQVYLVGGYGGINLASLSGGDISILGLANTEFKVQVPAEINQGLKIPILAHATDTMVNLTLPGGIQISKKLSSFAGGGGGSGTDDQIASEVPFTPAVGLSATDVQSAIEETINQLLTYINNALTTLNPSYLLQNGATTGQVLAWNGTNWAPANGGGGVAYNDSIIKDSLRLAFTEIDAIGSGASDGTPTAGAYDSSNHEIDITVASPGTNFSIDLTGIAKTSDIPTPFDNSDNEDSLAAHLTRIQDLEGIPIGYTDSEIDDKLITQDVIIMSGNLTYNDSHAGKLIINRTANSYTYTLASGSTMPLNTQSITFLNEGTGDIVVNDGPATLKLFKDSIATTYTITTLSFLKRNGNDQFFLSGGKAAAGGSGTTQTLSLAGTALTISGGNTANFTGWDTDASDDFDGDYNSLSNKPTIPAAFDNSDNEDSLAAHLTRIQALEAAPPGYSDSDIDGNEAAFTGWDKNAADDFDGDYNSLTNKPTLFDGQFSSLTGTPDIVLFSDTLSEIATKADLQTATGGSIQNLSLSGTALSISGGNTANFTGWDTDASDDFDGNYTSLSNRPTLFDGQYSSLTGIPVTFTPSAHTHAAADVTSGTFNIARIPTGTTSSTVALGNHTHTWSAITGKPTFATVATSGSYTDLLNLPTLFDGNYNNLSNKPTLFDGQFSSLTGTPDLIVFGDTLSEIATKADLQTATGGSIQSLSLTGTALSISGGNTANFTGWDTDASDDFDGDYNSLSNKPTIPAAFDDSDIQDSLSDHLSRIKVVEGWGDYRQYGLGDLPVQQNNLPYYDSLPDQISFYKSTSGSNNPFGKAGVGIHVPYASDKRGGQLWMSLAGDLLYRTSNSGGTWMPVRQVWHDGDFTSTNISNWNAAYTFSQSPSMAWSAVTGKPTFSTVATSGSYNDLSNKPTIPAAFDNSDNEDSLAAHLSRIQALEAAPPGYSDSDIDGNEAAFTGWDKNAADDFDGAYGSLSGVPASFTPSAHTHTASEVTDFNTAVAANSAVTANTAKVSNATHTGDVTGSTALTISNNAVTTTKINNAAVTMPKLAAQSSKTVIANNGGTTTSPTAITYTTLKSEMALNNVDNTSDANKPISTATQTALNLKANTASLATVATSGSYNDLSNKPTIPAAFDNSDNEDSLAAHLARIQALEAAPPGYSDSDIDGNEAAFTGWDKNAADDFDGQYSSLTGTPATFTPSAHTHAAADVSSGTFNIARIPTGTTSSTVALGNHTHTFASLTSKPTTLSGYGITDAATSAQLAAEQVKIMALQDSVDSLRLEINLLKDLVGELGCDSSYASPNMFNPATIKQDSLIRTSDQAIIYVAGWQMSSFIPVSAGDDYTLYGLNISSSSTYSWRDASNNVIGATGTGINTWNTGDTITLTAPVGAVTIAFNIKRSTDPTSVYDNLMMVEGTTVYPYSAHGTRVNPCSNAGGGTAYDQSLNTTDNVEFAGIKTSGLQLNLPDGNGTEPAGLQVGDMWIDWDGVSTSGTLKVKMQ